MLTSDPIRVAVIGSGFGGLAAAIRLQSAGFRVTVLEKRDLPGGRAYVYRDRGFTFDAGPTVITAPECLEEIFAVAGRRMNDYVELCPVTPMYRLCWEDGYRFDYTGDLDSTLAQIRSKSPGDVEGYRRFLEYTEEVFAEGYTKLAHVPFLSWGSMLRVAPQLMRLEAYRSVYAMVAKFIRDPQLRQAFSFHSLLVGGNPFKTSSIYTLIHFLERRWGVFFPRGGTGALVQGLVKLFRELGGEIEFGAEVDQIEVAGGRVVGVRDKSGARRSFDAVVSNADVARTYLDLLKGEPKAKAGRQKVERSSYSMSLFVLYFGTRKSYPEIAHHSVLFGPRYKSLLDDIFERGVLAEDFSLYLHAPSRTDPSLAPAGGEAFYVLSPVPHLGKADIDWKTVGPKYADRILAYLEKYYLPDLRRQIVTQRIFTPLDFKSELNAHLGSAFSIEPRLRQSAYFRTANRDPEIRGLYFVGAGTHPGAGIPGVVNSAKATAGILLDDREHGRLTAHAKVPPPLPAPHPTAGLSDALTRCREMITVGSKSFSLASRLFSPEIRNAAFFLYGWCRFCDDQIDQTVNLRLQRERLQALRADTLAAFENRPGCEAVFIALAHLVTKYRIPSHYALELLEGMAMDVRKERYWTFEDLTLYGYRVAGTVGLMMSHVMGVSDHRALRHAADLGIAMQLTNIARDILDDAAIDRVYLPLGWLDEAGVPENQLANPKYRRALARVVQRLLREADRYYESGRSGLRYLPWRSALAVAAASHVYAEIGRSIRRRGLAAWDHRTVVSGPRKAWAVLRGVGDVLASVPYRVLRPWKWTPIQMIWRHA